MATVLMPLPNRDFDPTETGVPCRLLRGRGHRLVLATPDGTPGQADTKMVTGKGLGIFAPFMKADANGRAAYDEMAQSAEFQRPISYGEIRADNLDGLLLPGGHELRGKSAGQQRFPGPHRPPIAISIGVAGSGNLQAR